MTATGLSRPIIMRKGSHSPKQVLCRYVLVLHVVLELSQRLFLVSPSPGEEDTDSELLRHKETIYLLTSF